jgi:hypothetical protein
MRYALREHEATIHPEVVKLRQELDEARMALRQLRNGVAYADKVLHD